MTAEQDAAYYVEMITRLLETRRYDWARPTLEGIRGKVEAKRAVSLRQREAIDHIILGRLKHDVGVIPD